MHKQSEWVQVLSRFGDAMTFRLNQVQQGSGAAAEFFSYIQVASEFMDWAFLTQEEIIMKHEQES
jgi:hypothetical protein